MCLPSVVSPLLSSSVSCSSVGVYTISITSYSPSETAGDTAGIYSGIISVFSSVSSLDISQLEIQ